MEKHALPPSVYLMASQNDKAASELLTLLESIDLCVRDDVTGADSAPLCNRNDIAGLLTNTSEKLRQATILANGIAMKVGTQEMPVSQSECVPMQTRHAR